MSPTPRLRTARRRALVAGSLLVLLAGCRATRTEPNDVGDLLRAGRFAEAVETAEALHARSPDDPQTADALRLARTAFVLEQGRRATFQDRDAEALELFLQADRLSPDEWVVDAWIDKTRRKLGEHWLDVAQELSAGDDLEGALEAFERAKAYNPDDRRADEGITFLLVRMNYRQGRGSQYYKEGVSALRDFWLNYARSRLSYAKKYLGETDDVVSRLDEIEAQKAEERLAVAREFEALALFGAARNEYRIAKLLDPENEEAEHGQRRMQDEASAEELLRAADMLVRKRRLAEAEEKVDQAAHLSELQHERIASMRTQLRDARFQERYDAAYDLEQDSKYVEASEAYGELLEEAGYFQDAIARKQTLDEFIADAERLYAQYEAAKTPAEGWGYLRQIALFWPEYRDVRALLAEAPDDFGQPPAPAPEAEPELSPDDLPVDEPVEETMEAAEEPTEEPAEDEPVEEAEPPAR